MARKYDEGPWEAEGPRGRWSEPKVLREPAEKIPRREREQLESHQRTWEKELSAKSGTSQASVKLEAIREYAKNNPYATKKQIAEGSQQTMAWVNQAERKGIIRGGRSAGGYTATTASIPSRAVMEHGWRMGVHEGKPRSESSVGEFMRTYPKVYAEAKARGETLEQKQAGEREVENIARLRRQADVAEKQGAYFHKQSEKHSWRGEAKQAQEMGRQGLAAQTQAENLRKAADAQERALMTGPRGGQFYVSPTGAKVYEKPNPGWVTENPDNPVDQIARYMLRGDGPWKR